MRTRWSITVLVGLTAVLGLLYMHGLESHGQAVGAVDGALGSQSLTAGSDAHDSGHSHGHDLMVLCLATLAATTTVLISRRAASSLTAAIRPVVRSLLVQRADTHRVGRPPGPVSLCVFRC